ncbi:zinc-binding alcohol dehydrogenase family protein [Stigmatella aurantiaca]|uniref:Zinc-type alcohol dehydrogenase-like protein n=1 Tax=Stigmatella aurantiaca (strain DW4/3-1) TaxID=378806 RepID=Q09C96_STIAD|nr:zinc-binding alcohol dehydrogenase family protein [Stigmatella aurantiaca]ADO69545.1 Zinc-containing alcohol dehydrogenase superfamily [Stigmatella aurantiaca DW4/3-1]EAU69368.1 zinc-containing alcohol dehydrogenase superfamily [Stigmatella aurantiaca DW4/3-1]
MKAIGYYQPLPIENPESLQDIVLPEPVPGEHDLLVEVRAIAVNPVDTKVRRGATPKPGEARVPGWDAAGVVRSVGSQVTLFKPGDRVWYAGDLNRPGSYSERHLVDERIAGHMPVSLDFAHAAALPLTTITAWELLFDRLRVQDADPAQNSSVLVIGAAGGVGSILVQLARQLTGLTVIGTASRPETSDWVRGLGAHHVIDHGKPIAAELKRAGLGEVSYAISLTHTNMHFAQIVEALAPQGKVALIDDPEPIDVRLLKRKSASLHWELMFTRSMFQTADMKRQHDLLGRVAALIDAGTLKTTFSEHFGTINAKNLQRAHALIESNKARGKIVLEGF